MKKIGIFIFEQVELLDFAGPLEVFGVAKYLDSSLDLSVTTIGLQDIVTISKTDLKAMPFTTQKEKFDLLIIPGGTGSRKIIKDSKQLNFINDLIVKSKIVASVCTGALILGELGYLKGIKATTHRDGIQELLEIDPSIVIQDNKRFVDNGRFITAAGISAGIDMSLYIIEKNFGSALKNKIIKYMEYDN